MLKKQFTKYKNSSDLLPGDLSNYNICFWFYIGQIKGRRINSRVEDTQFELLFNGIDTMEEVLKIT